MNRKTMQGRIGGTTIVTAAAHRYRQAATVGVFAAAAISLTACDTNATTAPEAPPKNLTAVCADPHNIRVDESYCPQWETTDEDGYGTGEYEPDYWGTSAPNGWHWMFYGQNPTVTYIIPEYGYTVAGTGGTYLHPSTNNYVNRYGYMPAGGGTLTHGNKLAAKPATNTKPGNPHVSRNGFGGGTSKGTSSGS